MTLADAVFLGVVQGLTEFLPISSSGHLVLLGEALGLELPGLTFEIGVHLGTLAAVVAVYRHRLLAITRGLAGVLLRAAVRRQPGLLWSAAGDARLGCLLLLAMLPTAGVALSLRPVVTGLFSSSLAVAACWLVTGAVLWSLPRLGDGTTHLAGVRGPQALWVGMLQGLAVLPGISRSGLTLFGGMAAGLGRRDAADFSFLLAVPAIAGAAAVELPVYLAAPPAGLPPTVLLGGMVAAALAGYAAIRWFLQLVAAGSIHRFAYYCWTLGGTVMLLWYFGIVT